MATRTSLWTYDTTLDTKTGNWTGYDVDASDGHIGKIDEMSTEAGRGWIVVDTGFWIFGKKRLIPAGSVRFVDHAERRVRLSLTKDQVKDAPDFEKIRDDDPDYFDPFETYYTRSGV